MTKFDFYVILLIKQNKAGADKMHEMPQTLTLPRNSELVKRIQRKYQEYRERYRTAKNETAKLILFYRIYIFAEVIKRQTVSVEELMDDLLKKTIFVEHHYFEDACLVIDSYLRGELSNLQGGTGLSEEKKGQPKIGMSSTGEPMHYSVGAVIMDGKGRYLLIDRAKPPFGFAGVAGHIDEGEEAIMALPREIKEETGLELKKFRFLFEGEIPGNRCSRGVNVHYWHLFACVAEGRININPKEVKKIGWYSAHRIKEMAEEGILEPIWEYWFKMLGII